MRLRRGLVIAALVLVLAVPASVAQEAESKVLDWESGRNKSYFIPALEIPAFNLGLNAVDRLIFENSTDYDVTWDSIARNFQSTPEFDKDPFSVNQIGHP